MAECKDCIHFCVCSPYTAPNESYPEVDGCKCFRATADVVPKSEVDNWYQLYHSIKEELKQEKRYHRETENLCDRYCIESQHAKKQIAREIFEEIEKILIDSAYIPDCARFVDIDKLAELKKKYTENENG